MKVKSWCNVYFESREAICTMRLQSSKFILGALLHTLICVNASGESWNQFLGNQRNATATYSFEIDPSNQPSVQWKVPVGAGYTTPLVHEDSDAGEDVVFAFSRENGNEVLTKIQLSDGEVLWKRDWPVPFTAAGGGEKHGVGPKASAVLINGFLVTVSIDGTLRGHSTKSGEMLWKRLDNREFGKGYPNWGASYSPIIVGKLVILRMGDDEGGRLLALNPMDGQSLWQVDGPGPSYASANRGTFDEIDQIIDWNHETLQGVAPGNGQTLWSIPFPHVGVDQNSPTPMIDGGVIFLGAENRGLHAYIPSRNAQGNWTINEIWKRDDLALNMATALVKDGRLWGLSHYDRGRLVCLNATDGTTVWESQPRFGEQVNLVSIGDSILAITSDGRLIILNAKASEYDPVAVYGLGELGMGSRFWSPPTPVRNGVLVKDDEFIYRLGF
ncbi:MAG: PQQ-binding-like beta-propeller repeat protein [Planctomycetota bacterium]